jgi:hypothetical protein
LLKSVSIVVEKKWEIIKPKVGLSDYLRSEFQTNRAITETLGMNFGMIKQEFA